MATPDTSLGIDYSIRSGADGDDLDGAFGEIYGAQVLLEDAYKTITTTAGSLEWDPSGTIDVTEQLGESADVTDRQFLQSQIAALLADDPRVQDVGVDVAYDFGSKTLKTTIQETPVTGETFTMVVTAGSNAVDVERVS